MAYLNNLGSFKKCDAVVIMFRHACCYGENVRVEDDVMAIEAHLLDQQVVRTGTDLNFSVCFCCLHKNKTANSNYY